MDETGEFVMNGIKEGSLPNLALDETGLWMMSGFLVRQKMLYNLPTNTAIE